MKPLNKRELAYWKQYINVLPPEERPEFPFIEAECCGNKDITDGLLELFLEGKKTAGSGLVQDYLSCDDPLPKIGNYWIILDSKDQPCCIVKTIHIEFNKFENIPASVAIAEGEGDLSIDYWKRVHSELYAPHLEKWGINNLDEADVVTEYFEIVHI